MISTETRMIDGYSIAVSQLPAMQALKMSARLGKLLGGPMSKALGTLDVSDLKTADMAVIGGALLSLFESLDENELERLVKTFLQAATLDGKPFLQVMEAVLAGQVLTIYKALGFALEVNYKDFFAGLAGLGARVKAQAGAVKSS